MAELKDSDIVWDEVPQVSDDEIVWDDAPEVPERLLREPESYTWGEAIGGAVKNAPSSLRNTANTFYELLSHPADSARAIGALIEGGIQSIPGNYAPQSGVPDQRAVFDSLLQHYKDNVFNVEGVKRYLHDDPVMLGTELIPAAKGVGQLVKGGAKTVAATGIPRAMAEVGQETFGKMTGMGRRPVQRSIRGVEEGVGPDLLPTGRASTAKQVVDKVVENVRGYTKQEWKKFNDSIASLKTSPAKVEMVGIKKDFLAEIKEMYDVKAIYNPKDKTVKFDFDLSALENNTPAQQTVQKVWDSLSKRSGNISIDEANTLRRNLRSTYVEGANGEVRQISTAIANKVKDRAIKAEPKYGETLKNISEAQDLLDDFTKAVGDTGNKLNPDQLLRKLAQTGRDGFEIRAHFVDEVAKATGTDINGLLAGYMSQPYLPQGMGGKIAAYSAVGGAGAATAVAGNPAIAAAIASVLLTGSPKLVSNTLRTLGASKRMIKNFMAKRPKISGKAGAAVVAPTAQKIREGEYDSLINQSLNP
jgi:hypothetical protein